MLAILLMLGCGCQSPAPTESDSLPVDSDPPPTPEETGFEVEYPCETSYGNTCDPSYEDFVAGRKERLSLLGGAPRGPYCMGAARLPQACAEFFPSFGGRCPTVADLPFDTGMEGWGSLDTTREYEGRTYIVRGMLRFLIPLPPEQAGPGRELAGLYFDAETGELVLFSIDNSEHLWCCEEGGLAHELVFGDLSLVECMPYGSGL
ncbi:MAG: hypothetical protein R3F61_36365 [Myxococcota bacterium]